MKQTFRIQHQRGDKLFNRRDLANMLREAAKMLEKHADHFDSDPFDYAGGIGSFPPRFEISATIRKNDTYPAYLLIEDFRPKCDTGCP